MKKIEKLGNKKMPSQPQKIFLGAWTARMKGPPTDLNLSLALSRRLTKISIQAGKFNSLFHFNLKKM